VTPKFLPLACLLGVMVASHAIAAILGRLLPRVGGSIALVSLLAVAAMWTLLAIEEPDGPGGGLGVVIVTGTSLALLSAGAGLIAGSRSNIGISIGLVLGLLASAIIHLWLYPHAHPFIGACLVVSFPVAGYALSASHRRRPTERIHNRGRHSLLSD